MFTEIMKVEVKDSSAIKSYEYNKSTKMLKVLFVNGKQMYDYPDVPEEVVKNWNNSDSMGKYFNREIKRYAR